MLPWLLVLCCTRLLACVLPLILLLTWKTPFVLLRA